MKGGDNMYNLSARETAVLTVAAQGCSNKEIAEKLFITERTVKAHMSSIFKKLNVKNRTAAVMAVTSKEQISN